MNIKLNLRKWDLNCEITDLTANERKEATILLSFLNATNNEKEAFDQLKTNWLNVIYPLPTTDNKKMYSTATSVRYQTLKRIKELYAKHIIQ